MAKYSLSFTLETHIEINLLYLTSRTRIGWIFGHLLDFYVFGSGNEIKSFIENQILTIFDIQIFSLQN